MTPLEIHCLLEYHTFPGDSSDIHNRNPMAVDAMIGYGFIKDVPSVGEPKHSITERGTFYVEQLQALPLPVLHWTIPDENA